MPIYEYRCRNGHQFEVFQAMSEDPVSSCQVCGEPVERVFRPVAVHFKGSGFYTTDYARKASAKESADGAKASDDGAGQEKKESGQEKKESKKPATASAGKDD
ncbi:MAG TPA: FmdB family zinc ribbon protein [Solirubrobacterales bacterium]|nr:FmdB family zinc ribbon protein [Solirubrobacterales bacterium]